MQSAARAARRALLLDEAAVEFRRNGVAGADLIRIARNVGLTRPSLYNYCSDRSDLARQCYFHLLDPLLADLDRAAEAASGLAAVLSFLTAASERDQSHAIIAAELDTLPVDQKREIVTRQTEAFDLLAALIDRGIADGSIRRCDPAIAARTIWGMIAWAPLGDIWAKRAEPSRLSVELPGIVERGVATGPAPGRIEDIEIEDWGALVPPPPVDRAGEIVAAASALFNARGVEGVSLDDVAAAMSATKGLIYHHFATKAELVAASLDRAFELYDRLLDCAERHPCGVDRARAGLALNVQAQLDPAGPMSLTAAAYHKLPDSERERFSKQTNHLLDRSIATMELGNADGSLRLFEAEPTALVSAGTFNFVARWLPVDTDLLPRQVAFEVSTLFLHGLSEK
ncbi:TetR family transcriptional regulator [Sphingopyxis sp.]|uniref:TetR family transcriptional regulator n=1 Tax=Sphingopyxis sp. TaxID=1908224 RepID=UPI002623C785|nr:TetR family transcriptional regulator [Sphingopyxis sp.]MCW0196522.1 TetR family transcriptional regulator [Sphingopyxis sp.]